MNHRPRFRFRIRPWLALTLLLSACAGDAANEPSDITAGDRRGGQGGAWERGGAGGGAPSAGGMTPAQAGTGGDAGQPGMATGGSAGGPGAGCADAKVVLCDDFEAVAAGSGPAAPNWKPQPDWQQERIRVTSDRAHSGKNAVTLVGTNYAVQLIAAKGAPPPDNRFYVRVYMQTEKRTSDINGHVAFIEGAENENDSGEELRLGASHGMLDLNLIPGNKGTGGGEKTQFSNGDVDVPSSGKPGVVLEANRWYCVEALFDGMNHEFRLWVDDQEVAGLHVTDWKQGRTNWSPEFRFVKIGAQNFSADAGRVYYDDVAISGNRIGCN